MDTDWLPVDFHIRLIGVLSFVFVAYAYWLGQPTAKRALPHDHRNPVLALSLAKSGSEIVDIKEADEDGNVGTQLKKDWGFIAVYLILFLLLSFLLVRLSAPAGKWLGWVAAIFATLAAISDLVENFGMTKALAEPIANDSLAHLIRYASLSKWTATYFFALVVGLIFFSRSGWVILPGLLMIAAALVGITGVAVNLFNQDFHLTFPISLGALALATVCIVFLFTFCSRYVFDNFPAHPREVYARLIL